MAIIYSYSNNEDLLPSDRLVGTATTLHNGKARKVTKNFTLAKLKDFINTGDTPVDTYVPYTGATQDVNLGDNNFSVGNGSLGISLLSNLGIIVSEGNNASNILPDSITLENTPLNTSATLNSEGELILDKQGLGFKGTLTAYNIGNNVTLDFPNKPEGTYVIATTNDLPSITPAALTKTDDTNVTLTLGGSPATALLQATSLTLGWTGTLADSRIASASTWNAKQNAITLGTTAQYFRGDLSLATFPTIPTVGTWGALNYPTWTTGTPFVKMTAAGIFALDTNTYLTSITSSDVTTALGYTPVTNARTLTINGVGYDLTADRSWTISTFTSPLTTKGDLFTYNSTNARLPVGLNTQVLIADSTTSTGLKWGTNTAATPTGYYGAFQDITNQTAAVINTGYPMKLGVTDLSNGVTVVSNSRVTIANTGIYNIQWSAQFTNPLSAEHDVTIWLRKNGVDVPGSSGIVLVPAKHGSSDGHTLPSWNFLLDVVAGDYYEFVWSTVNTSVYISFQPAGNPPPSTASVVLTVTQQSGIMAGTGITAINSLTGAVQTLTTGTTGTDFAISSTGTTHTFNLPTASASNRGALSSADWTTFNSKGSGTVTSVAALTLGTTGTDLSSSVATGTTTPVITLNVPDASATARGVITINGQTIAGAKTFSTAPILSSLTASQLLATDASKNVQSLTTATYPSLTELSYVKGVTSAIQTQLGTKLAGIHTLRTLPSGQSTSLSLNGVNLTTVVGTTNRMILTPYIPNVSFTSANLYINVSVLLLTANARILIYSDVNGVPTTKLYESANLDCSTLGIKTATTAFSFVAGTTYWLCTHSSSTPTYSGYTASQLFPFTTNGTVNYTSYTSTQTFGSAPTTLTGITISNANPPFIAITF